MIKNYFKIAWRNLFRNKLYTTLNVAGLGFGLTCFLLIGLYIFDELTFDEQHDKADRIYRVIEHKNVKGEETTIATGSYKLAEESKKVIAEIENTTRVSRTGRANLVDPENPVNVQETVTIADENFLEIFDFPLTHGDKKTALREPNSIIITKELALRIFKQTEVIGKTLEFGFIRDAPLKITGVLADHPRNSSFNFSSVISEATFRSSEDYKQTMAFDWSSNDFSVYALLKPNTHATEVSKKITQMVLANFKPEAGTTLGFSLQPLTDIHLYSKNIIDGGRNSNVDSIAQGSSFYLKIFGFVALFVLLIASINYMNLSTARASNRSKEIGIKKSVGALRSNLIYQFLFESILVTGISFLLAIILVNLLLPSVNHFTNKQLSLWIGSDHRIWLYAIIATLLIGIISGSYPALLLSGYKPVSLLKGIKISDKSSLGLRRGLVIFQFAVSIIMIVATMIIFLQVRFFNTTNLGFNKDLLVVVDVNSGKARSDFETIKTEMKKIPTVKNVSVTSRVPGEWKDIRQVKIRPTGNTEELKTSYLFGADEDFFKTFEARLVNGRNFINAQDSSSVIINETAAKMLNIQEASGQTVEIPSSSRGGSFSPINKPFIARVIGIVKDFHFQSLHEKIAPLVLAYCLNPVHNLDYFTARMDANDIEATLSKLKAVMISIDKNDPFEYHFLDEQLAIFYIEDHRRQTMLIWVALATIFIACLGLFGLATYSAEQRVKEIGIRKVVGASVFNLASLLSKDFIKLVMIAIVIAFPIAWWAADKWLQEFPYHINMKWWVFALAGVLAIVIALFTVSFQAIKAAIANPVKSLRTE